MEDRIFIDVTCPKCGRTIGNAGSGGMFCCECGYVGNGGLCKEDVELIRKFYQCAAARDRETQDK